MCIRDRNMYYAAIRNTCGLVIIFPLVIMYLFCQRYLVQGIEDVYKRQEYGDILINALKNQNERQFDRAIEDWTEILKRNSNFDTAYIGIGQAYSRNGNYKEALKYYEAAYDNENWSCLLYTSS